MNETRTRGKRRRLGRGLGSLISTPVAIDATEERDADATPSDASTEPQDDAGRAAGASDATPGNPADQESAEPSHADRQQGGDAGGAADRGHAPRQGESTEQTPETPAGRPADEESAVAAPSTAVGSPREHDQPMDPSSAPPPASTDSAGGAVTRANVGGADAGQGVDPPDADASAAASDRSGAPGRHAPPATEVDPTHRVVRLPVDSILPNPHQPRKQFDDGGLAALAESIRTAGVMQPILVRRRRHPTPAPGNSAPAPANSAPAPGRIGPGDSRNATAPDAPASTGEPHHAYELIAGERRLRAAKLVPLETIPAIIRDLDEREAAEWALIENLQREDLNPIERAEAFRELIDRFDLTHQELAERVGVDRSSISNLLRLNDLDDASRDFVRAGRLSLGHAKALLAIPDAGARGRLASKAAAQEWSVRELERKVRALLKANAADGSWDVDGAGGAAGSSPSWAGGRGGGAGGDGAGRAHLRDLERQLEQHLGTRVRLTPGRKKGAGKLTIEFYSFDEFDGLMQRLGFETEG